MSKYSNYEPGSTDLSGAARTASEYAGHAGEEDFFGGILNSLTGKHEQLANQEIDEDHQQNLVKQHETFFGGGSQADGNFGAGSLGGAAAMQALKMFIGGQQMSQVGASSGGAQNAFVGMAMGEAAKLFEAQKAQGNTDPSVSKDSVVQHAAETAFKMYLQSQGGQSTGGGASLMGLASKFM